MNKVCIKCGVQQPEAAFPFNKYGRKVYRRNVCRACYDASRLNHENDEKPDGRTCRKCGEYKPVTAFPKNRQCLYGIEPVCKACKIARRREYLALYPERAKNSDLKYQYGITLADYHAMFARHEGRCAICGTTEEKLVVDHHHGTGRVRSLLCHHGTGRVRSLLCHLCNAMLGCAREREDILTRAIAYLRAAASPADADR